MNGTLWCVDFMDVIIGNIPFSKWVYYTIIYYYCVVGVNNRYQLGQALHFHLSEIDYFYMAVLAPIKDVGGMDNVKLIAKIYIMLFSWADQSGYPVLPIK